MSEDRDFDVAMRNGSSVRVDSATRRQVAVTESVQKKRCEDAPVKVEYGNRNNNNRERDPLGQLPTCPFQREGDEHHERKRRDQPNSTAPRHKQRQRRRGDCRVRSEAKVGVEVHEQSNVPMKKARSSLP